jgi:hypothetical protein
MADEADVTILFKLGKGNAGPGDTSQMSKSQRSYSSTKAYQLYYYAIIPRKLLLIC